MTYQPIENYGIVGNAHSAALVGMNGSIDWLCFPHLDSPTVFAALLDDKIGGRFQITPISTGFNCKQHYWPDTNVLVTRFLSPDGVGEVADFMPVGLEKEELGHHQLVRLVKVARGAMAFRVNVRPAFNYARTPHQLTLHGTGAIFET